jgi:hypothetical protein
MSHLPRLRRAVTVLARRRFRPLLVLALLAGSGVSAWAIVTLSELAIVKQLHQPVHVKTFMNELNDLVTAGKSLEAFNLAFERGDIIFGNTFNAIDGSGVKIGTGERYSHVPRADLTGPMQWFNHTPLRVTGPNAAGCFECHNVPVEDGGGLPGGNVHRDPTRSATISKFIQRNTPHLFGAGGIQRLAEEMTDDLRGKVAAAITACPNVGCRSP